MCREDSKPKGDFPVGLLRNCVVVGVRVPCLALVVCGRLPPVVGLPWLFTDLSHLARSLRVRGPVASVVLEVLWVFFLLMVVLPWYPELPHSGDRVG